MRTPPSISVITVTYNLIEAGRRDSFERAAACVRAQDSEGQEHVIQDGASSDGTQGLIAELISGDPAARFVSEPDGGLYDGMNKAVARARGDYVLFLNSDDALAAPDVLRHVQAELAAHAPDFAYGATARRDDEGREHVARRTSLKAVLQRMPFCHNSVLIRRKVFLALGGHDTAFPVAADYDLVLRMVDAGYQGLRLDIPISLFWTRGVSADDDRVATDYARVWQRYFQGAKAAAGLTLEDYKRFYRQGHMPPGLLMHVLARAGAKPAMRRAALHGLGKSLRRGLQPWRDFERTGA